MDTLQCQSSHQSMSSNHPTVPNLIHQIGGFQQRLKDPERNKTGECEDSTYLTLERKKINKKNTRKLVKFRNLQLIFKQNVCQKSKIVIQLTVSLQKLPESSTLVQTPPPILTADPGTLLTEQKEDDLVSGNSSNPRTMHGCLGFLIKGSTCLLLSESSLTIFLH